MKKLSYLVVLVAVLVLTTSYTNSPKATDIPTVLEETPTVADFLVPVLVGHPCPEGVSSECCGECTAVCTDFCLQAAQQAFDDCSALYADTPFLISVICTPEHINDVTDCNNHVGEFDFSTCINSCTSESTTAACADDPATCVAAAAATKVACQQACPSGNSGKDCRKACQTTFLTAVHNCHNHAGGHP